MTVLKKRCSTCLLLHHHIFFAFFLLEMLCTKPAKQSYFPQLYTTFSPKTIKKTFFATNEFQAFASFPNSASPSLRHHVLWMLFKANQFQPECQIPATGCSKALLKAQNCYERPLPTK